MKKKVVIIGAGPAGITAGYELLRKSNNYEVLILEQENQIGGISKTVKYNGNYMDLGGHRFFSKNDEINKMWQELLPVQGSGSYDDIKLKNHKHFPKNGPNPEKTDKVFLVRNRISRIYYNNRFFDYPINLSLKTIKNLGIKNTIVSGFSYLKSIFLKKDESNLENFYINRFGKKLYTIFFKGYTNKLWGRSPKEIDSSWGKQRVKGLSIIEVLKDCFYKIVKKENKNKQVSLIEQFYYPKYGPGQMWDVMKERITELGGIIKCNSKVINLKKNNNRISEVTYLDSGRKITVKCDYVISTMPIKELINDMNDVPNRIKKIANNLPYRDFITVGLVIDKLKIKNETNIETINNIVPDCWIYVQNENVKLGRIQIFNNWSPYLVNDLEKSISLGLEYFCTENDDFWLKSDDELKNIALNELIKMNVVSEDVYIKDFHIERVKKAYPAYFDSYKDFPKVKKYLNRIENLYCIGRNGQHRYNNMDHSMECAIVCVNNIINNVIAKDNIWAVNTDENYHEIKEKLNE